MTLACGTISESSSTRLGASSATIIVTPVRLPPGRAKLATRPRSTGSEPLMNTTGIVGVASFATLAEGIASAAITSTLRPTRSAANAGSSSKRPSPSGIQSRRFVLRCSPFLPARAETRPQAPWPNLVRDCQESQSPASPSAVRARRAPGSSHNPAGARTRGVSLDDLVGASEDRWRDRYPEHGRSLHVYHQLELGRLLDRNIHGLCAAQDLDALAGELAVHFGEARTVGGETTFPRRLRPLVDRGKSERGAPVQYDFAIAVEEG